MELPEDLVARILSRLHPLEALKAKLVCRSWRRAISPSPSPSPSPLGFAIHPPDSLVTLLYADLTLSRWVHLPLLTEPASLLAIASPFLCLSTTSASKPHVTGLHLVNPLTRVRMCIPPFLPQSAPFLVGLCKDPLNHHGFKIVIAGEKTIADQSLPLDGECDLPVQIFDSEKNSWRVAGLVSGAGSSYANPVCMGHQIFWLCESFRKYVLVFDSVDESWSMLGALWPQNVRPFTLWAWDGHLYLAGKLYNARKLDIFLTIWKLVDEKLEWFTCIRVEDEYGEIHGAAGHGNLLCIMMEVPAKFLVCDLCTLSRSWLPYNLPTNCYNWRNVIPYMLSFSNQVMDNND